MPQEQIAPAGGNASIQGATPTERISHKNCMKLRCWQIQPKKTAV